MPFRLNQRVVSAENHNTRGTVRFVGQLDGYKGEWVGVEWDDPSRGKHSGEVSGKKYFICHVEGSGSFVRPQKLFCGQTLVEALLSRYGRGGLDFKGEMNLYRMRKKGALQVEFRHQKQEHPLGPCGPYLPPHSAGTNNPTESSSAGTSSKSEHKLVGVTKKPSSEILPLLRGSAAYLPGSDCVASLGPEDQLQQLTRDLQELAMPDSLVSDWKTVHDLLQRIPSLVALDISGAHLQDTLSRSQSAEETPIWSECLSTLAINRCGFSWTQIVQISRILPSLSSLVACSNYLSCLRIPDGGMATVFKSLTALDFSHNSISDWSEILHLSQLPSLKTLVLSHNLLPSVFLPTSHDASAQLKDKSNLFTTSTRRASIQVSDEQAEGRSTIFPSLTALDLSYNNLSNFGSIHSLDKLPCLQRLIITHNPVWDSSPGLSLFIASLGGIHSLNGCIISEDERRNCELAYLNSVLSECSHTAKSLQEATKSHPRFQSLLVKYGYNFSEEVCSSSATHSERSVASRSSSPFILVKALAIEDGKKQGEIKTKKLPRTTKVRQLKSLIPRFLGVQQTASKLPAMLLFDEGNLSRPVLLEKDEDTFESFQDVCSPLLVLDFSAPAHFEALPREEILAWEIGITNGVKLCLQ